MRLRTRLLGLTRAALLVVMAALACQGLSQVRTWNWTFNDYTGVGFIIESAPPYPHPGHWAYFDTMSAPPGFNWDTGGITYGVYYWSGGAPHFTSQATGFWIRGTLNPPVVPYTVRCTTNFGPPQTFDGVVDSRPPEQQEAAVKIGAGFQAFASKVTPQVWDVSISGRVYNTEGPVDQVAVEAWNGSQWIGIVPRGNSVHAVTANGNLAGSFRGLATATPTFRVREPHTNYNTGYFSTNGTREHVQPRRLRSLSRPNAFEFRQRSPVMGPRG